MSFLIEIGYFFSFKYSILEVIYQKCAVYPRKSVFWIFTTMCLNYQDFKRGWSYTYWVWPFMLGWSWVCFFTFYLNPPERTVGALSLTGLVAKVSLKLLDQNFLFHVFTWPSDYFWNCLCWVFLQKWKQWVDIGVFETPKFAY